MSKWAENFERQFKSVGKLKRMSKEMERGMLKKDREYLKKYREKYK